MIHRSIIITENQKQIIRNDSNVNGYDNFEKELFNFIMILDYKNMLNSKKLMNMLKIKHNDIGILTIPEIIKNPENWMINENTKKV